MPSPRNVTLREAVCSLCHKKCVGATLGRGTSFLLCAPCCRSLAEKIEYGTHQGRVARG